MSEINLLKRYPKTKRVSIIEDRKIISEEEKELALELEKNGYVAFEEMA